MNDFQVFLSSVGSFLTFLSLRLFLVTSLHVFLDCPLGKVTKTLKVVHLLDQARSSLLSA